MIIYQQTKAHSDTNQDLSLNSSLETEFTLDIHHLQPYIPAILTIYQPFIISNALVLIRLTKYNISIDLIVFIDVGVVTFILHPSRISFEYWKSYTQHFRAANNKVFTTNLISKSPFTLSFFQDCWLNTNLLVQILPKITLLLDLIF